MKSRETSFAEEYRVKENFLVDTKIRIALDISLGLQERQDAFMWLKERVLDSVKIEAMIEDGARQKGVSNQGPIDVEIGLRNKIMAALPQISASL
jgi:hypothetical protein